MAFLNVTNETTRPEKLVGLLLSRKMNLKLNFCFGVRKLHQFQEIL